MTNEYTPSEALQEKVAQFFTGHDMALLNQNLRRQLLDYLDHELRGSVPVYFDDFLYPLNDLLDLINTAAQEIQEENFKRRSQIIQTILRDSTKEKVIAFIVSTLSPEQVFLLHHAVDADERERFDMLVVIPSTSNTSFSHYEEVLRLAKIDGAVITASLIKAEALNEQLIAGHIYYTLACTEDKLVYDTGENRLPEANTGALAPLIAKARDVFDAAKKKSVSFFNGADMYLQNDNAAMAAFMLEQSAEILLRGFITALLGNCTKTHCLRELKKPLERCAPEIEYLLCKNVTTENRLLQLLEKAYLESRYNEMFIISDVDVAFLYKCIKGLRTYVAEVFEGKMEQLSEAAQ